jgi:hypothetical protein
LSKTSAIKWILQGVGIISVGLGVIALGVTLHLVRVRTLTQDVIDQVEGAAKAQSLTAAGPAPDRQS